MAGDPHHEPDLLRDPATIVLLAGSLVVAALVALSGSDFAVSALLGAVLVGGGMVGLRFLVRGGHR